MMHWILLLMATVAFVVVAMVVGGLLSPRIRVATRVLTCDRARAEVYRLLRQADGPPPWCPSLPTMRAEDEIEDERVRFALEDDDGTPIGSWVVTVSEGGGRTVATITESVSVSNPVLRFLRSFGGNGARPQAFLQAVAGELGVPALVRDHDMPERSV